MAVRKRPHALGLLQKTPKGEERFNPATSSPIRCKACSRLMDPSYALEKASRCPNCRTKFKKKDWAEMAAEAMQISSQGGWDRDKLERLEDEKTGTSAYIGKDKTTYKQNEKARNMAKWAVRERRRNAKLKRAKVWGGSSVNDILMSNPYR